MWWRPDTEAEIAITKFLARLAEGFDAQSVPFVQGFGSTLHDGYRVPLIVLDKRLLVSPIKAEIDALLGQVEDNFRRIFKSLGFTIELFDRDDVFYPLSNAGENTFRLLRPYSPPGDTLVAYAAPPKLNALRKSRKTRYTAAGPGAPVRGKNLAQSETSGPRRSSSHGNWKIGKDATIGFVLKVGDNICATTAGHLVTSAPCDIATRERRMLGLRADRVERIGQIQVHSYNDPRGMCGPDVALIDLDHAFGAQTQPFKAVLPGQVASRAPVTLRGARSGEARGWVVGAMCRTIEEAGRIWSNSWWVNHFDTGFGQEGDSGGRVALEDQELVLGHLVGSVGVIGRNGQRQMGIVQDMETILDFVERARTGKKRARTGRQIGLVNATIVGKSIVTIT